MVLVVFDSPTAPAWKPQFFTRNLEKSALPQIISKCIGKYSFGCQTKDTAMRRCTKAERIERTAENRSKAKEREQEMMENYRRAKANPDKLF